MNSNYVADRVKKFIPILFGLLLFNHATAANTEVKQNGNCTKLSGWFKSRCLRFHQIWAEGRNELYLPTYAWHNRFTYDPSKISSYNEFPFGAGLGKSFYDEDGDWHGLYAMAFLDSHSNVEPALGYTFHKTAHFKEKGHIGVGASFLVSSRPDIMHYIPIAGVLPSFSIGYGQLSISGAYIPGSSNVGNVLFLITRVLL